MKRVIAFIVFVILMVGCGKGTTNHEEKPSKDKPAASTPVSSSASTGQKSQLQLSIVIPFKTDKVPENTIVLWDAGDEYDIGAYSPTPIHSNTIEGSIADGIKIHHFGFLTETNQKRHMLEFKQWRGKKLQSMLFTNPHSTYESHIERLEKAGETAPAFFKAKELTTGEVTPWESIVVVGVDKKTICSFPITADTNITSRSEEGRIIFSGAYTIPVQKESEADYPWESIYITTRPGTSLTPKFDGDKTFVQEIEGYKIYSYPTTSTKAPVDYAVGYEVEGFIHDGKPLPVYFYAFQEKDWANGVSDRVIPEIITPIIMDTQAKMQIVH